MVRNIVRGGGDGVNFSDPIAIKEINLNIAKRKLDWNTQFKKHNVDVPIVLLHAILLIDRSL